MKILISVLLIAASFLAPARADERTEIRSFFERFKTLSDQFDPAVADLYADDAKITSIRLLPDGSTRTLALDGRSFKDLIRKAIPLAAQRGDRNTYTEPKIERDGAGNRFKLSTVRYSHLKGYNSPYVMVVERRGTAWRIVEEQSQTRP